MIQNELKNRIMQAYHYLCSIGLIHNVKDLAEKLGRARPGVNNAINGNEKYLTSSFVSHFAATFKDHISADWLMTGNGEMIVGVDTSSPTDKRIEDNQTANEDFLSAFDRYCDTYSLTQGQLAERIGTTSSVISNYRKGFKSVTAEITRRLKDLCDNSQATPQSSEQHTHQIDQSSLVNAIIASHETALAAKDETIISLQNELATQSDLIDTLKHEIASLRAQLAVKSDADILSSYPFKTGAAEDVNKETRPTK